VRNFNYLKKTFFIYLISSIVLGLAVSSLIIIHKYNRNLTDTINLMNNISANKEQVKSQIDKMGALVKYLKDNIVTNISDISSEGSFFQALDAMKTNLKGAAITMSKFEESGGEKRLPVEITIPVKNYRMIVDYAGFIESLNIPRYRVNSLSISKSNESKGGVVMRIQGHLLTPLVEQKGGKIEVPPAM